jgi:hypothetical protein
MQDNNNNNKRDRHGILNNLLSHSQQYKPEAFNAIL